MSSWSRLHRPRICPYIRPSLHLNPTSFDNPFVSVRHAISLWRKFWLYSTMHAQYDSSFFFLGFQFNQSMRRKVAPVSEQVVVQFDFPCFPFNFFFHSNARRVWQVLTTQDKLQATTCVSAVSFRYGLCFLSKRHFRQWNFVLLLPLATRLSQYCMINGWHRSFLVS